jgi:hypothetical protein
LLSGFLGRADNGLCVRRADVIDSSNHHTSGLDRIHPKCKPAIVHRKLVDLTSITKRTLQGGFTLQDILVVHRRRPLFINPLPVLRGWRRWAPGIPTRKVGA